MKKIAFVLSLLLASCNLADDEKLKFDKKLWDTKDDMEWPYRDNMLDDLIKNHNLVNLKYNEAVNLLGGSNFVASNELAYDINTYYGNDIDPVYTKVLSLKFNKDSIITSFEVKEWGKR